MAYRIVENNAVSFADNKSIKFPRFQRKQTWDERDNFKLCISVFKGYPIGVVIVNSQDGSDYLLDGRQRRNALKLMKDDPESVYKWARKFVGFGANQDDEEVKEKFWSSIDDYLQHDASRSKEEKEKELEENGEETNEPDLSQDVVDLNLSDVEKENSYSFEKQYNSLKSLLDLVLLCHPLKNNKTNLQKMYEFNGIVDKSDLDYADAVNGEYIINSVKLKRYIDGLIENEIDNVEDFSAAIIKRYKLSGNSESKTRNYIQQHWDYYQQSLNVIKKINDVLNHATVGMIALTNADILDAQNIFSLVNASGTPLTAEELLSARPFWNNKLNNPSAELIEYKKEMYKFLQINIPEETCLWDLCSTFLKRIDKNSLIFQNGKNSFTTSISLSYRIISGLLVKGINNTSVTSLEKARINWEVDIEKIIKDINFVISLLEDINFFKTVMSWGQSIMDLTSNSIAIEFCCLMYNSWIELGKPSKSSGNITTFNRRAVTLFDRLVYEYCIRLWTGSSDSLVANHLKDSSSRFEQVKENEWTVFIGEITSGLYKGKPTSAKTLKPFLYHYYFVKQMTPTLKNNNTHYEIDHLIAQTLFKENPSMDVKYKDNYLNFSLLPKGENIEKTNKKLNEINDEWLVTQIKKYADLSDELFNELADLSKLNKIELRKDSYIKAYTILRNSLFANL